jgi:hypothetical protein
MVRFQVLTTARMKMAVFRHVAQRSLIELSRRFRRDYYLHNQGDLMRMISRFSHAVPGSCTDLPH